jgi:hypothetical protein
MVIGRHSGRHILRQILLNKGVPDLDHVLVDKIYNLITESDNPELYGLPEFLLERYNQYKTETDGTQKYLNE